MDKGLLLEVDDGMPDAMKLDPIEIPIKDNGEAGIRRIKKEFEAFVGQRGYIINWIREEGNIIGYCKYVRKI
jgi:hypothetical protein